MNTPFSYRNSARLDVARAHDLAMAQIRQRIVGLDVKAPLIDGSKRPYVNFDNAATTPALVGRARNPGFVHAVVFQHSSRQGVKSRNLQRSVR